MPSYLCSLATALPSVAMTQPEFLKALQSTEVFKTLNERSRRRLSLLLQKDAPFIEKRYWSEEPGRLATLDGDALHNLFVEKAPELGARALSSALGQAEVAPQQLDALFVCTNTGALCGALGNLMAGRLPLRNNISSLDTCGMGCGAVLPLLELAHDYLCQRPQATVACVAVEICSAVFHLDDNPETQAGLSIFGDGAAAVILTGRPSSQRLGALQFSDFQNYKAPGSYPHIALSRREGRLRLSLNEAVPECAAVAVGDLWKRKSSRSVAEVIAHPGGTRVIERLRTVLPGYGFAATQAAFRRFGNQSCVSILTALGEHLDSCGAPPQDKDWWLAAFGAGFSAHACRLGWGSSS